MRSLLRPFPMKGTPAVDGYGFKHPPPPAIIFNKHFIELFAGSCRMALAFSAAGVESYSYEICRSPHEDVLLPSCTERILAEIEHQKILALWAGITCASWSRARRGPADYSGMPPPLQDSTKKGIWGLDGLRPRDVERVKLGNRLALWLCKVIRHCVLHKSTIFVENPQRSRLWEFPAMKNLLSQADLLYTFDTCQFGEAWKKSTTVAGWGTTLTFKDDRCHPRDNLCSRTLQPHEQLSGTHGGEWKTAAASAYPPVWCRYFVQNFLEDARARAKYGLRGRRIGEASHPGPARYDRLRRQVLMNRRLVTCKAKKVAVLRKHCLFFNRWLSDNANRARELRRSRDAHQADLDMARRRVSRAKQWFMLCRRIIVVRLTTSLPHISRLNRAAQKLSIERRRLKTIWTRVILQLRLHALELLRLTWERNGLQTGFDAALQEIDALQSA